MKKFRSLTGRLTFAISAIVLAIFMIIVFINFWITRSNLLDDAQADARNISALTVSQIQQELCVWSCQPNTWQSSFRRINSIKMNSVFC